jgi:hypothetical protein
MSVTIPLIRSQGAPSEAGPKMEKRPDFAENVIGDDNVAIEGYSPVSIFQRRPVLGKEDVTTVVCTQSSDDHLRMLLIW